MSSVLMGITFLHNGNSVFLTVYNRVVQCMILLLINMMGF